MGLRPNLGIFSNWEYLQEDRRQAVPYTANNGDIKHIPIPAFDFPIILDNPTLAILISSDEAEDTWRYAGHCSMVIRTGLIVGNNYDTAASNWVKLLLDKVNLVRFPSLASDYTLRVFPPRWFKSYVIIVYGYTGTGKADLEGKADAIYQEITAP